MLELIKQNADQFADAENEIDYILNLAPHQSNDIKAPNGAKSYSIDHDWDMLSGNDMGNNVGFKTNTASGSPGLSHKNKTFVKEVSAFINSWKDSKGDTKKLVDAFIKRMKKQGMKVTVRD